MPCQRLSHERNRSEAVAAVFRLLFFTCRCIYSIRWLIQGGLLRAIRRRWGQKAPHSICTAGRKHSENVMQPHTNGSSSADLKGMRVYVCTRTFAACLLQLWDLGNIGSDACRTAGASTSPFLLFLMVMTKRYQYQYINSSRTARL